MEEFKDNTQPNIRTEKKIGMMVILFFIGGFLLWACFASIESASIAQGKITVLGQDRIIEHYEGGMVNTINIQEGDKVKKGQILLTLNKIQAAGMAGMDKENFYEAMIIEARLLAELNNKSTIEYPSMILKHQNNPFIKKLIMVQESIFKADNELFASNLNIYQERGNQIQSQINGVQAQLDATNKQLAFANKELIDMRALEKERLIKQSELFALERESVGLNGQKGQQIAQAAALKQSLAEVHLQLNAEIGKRRQEILNNLRDVQVKLTEGKEKYKVSEDRLVRTQIRSPIDGIITNLKVNTIGEVVKPGETILEIVPQNMPLVARVQVNPLDIDVVHKGLVAKVRLSSYKPRTTPLLLGTVTHISADVVVDKMTQLSYYEATVVIDSNQLRKLKNVALYPGMPVEVMIITNKLTPFEYLWSPIKHSFSAAFKED